MKKKTIISSILAVCSMFVILGCSSKNVNTTTSNSTTTPSTTAGTKTHVHSPASSWTATDTGHYHACSGCQEHLDESEHAFEMSITKEATCEETGLMTYECSICHYKKTAVIEKKAHSYGELETSNLLKENSTCVWVVKTSSSCSECHEEDVISSSEYEKHNYQYAITTPATCSADGVITYTCSDCNKTYTKKYADPDAHSWNDGVVENGVTTYTCSLCGATKSTINAKNEVSSTVSASNLVAVNELELKNASIALDDSVKNQLSSAEQVNISADTVDKDNLQVDDDVKAQIGDNKVYDFNMTIDNNPVSQFNGLITVTLPYELAEGEDPNNVAIWYLSGDEPEVIEAKYSNGFVTFETSHFSLYTVIKMSKEQACALFGHNYRVVQEVEATCLSNGLEVSVCARCGEVKKVELPKTTHSWVEVENVPATKDNDGHISYQCEHCHETKLISFPKLVVDENNIILKVYDNLINQIKTDGYNATMTLSSDEESTNVSDIFIKDNKLILSNVSKASGRTTKMVNVIDLKTGSLESYEYMTGHVYKSTSSNKIPESALTILQLLFGNAAFDVKGIAKYFDTTKANELATNVFNLLFKKTEVSGDLEITLNNEKILDLYEKLPTMKVSGLVDLLLGEGTFAALSAKLSTYGTKTLTQVLEDLKTTLGVDIDGLFNFALQFASYVSSATDMKLPLDLSKYKEAYDEMLTKTVNEICAQYIDKDATVEQLVTVVNQYAEYGVLDLVGKIARRDISQSLPAKEAISSILDSIGFKLLATKDYEIKKLELELPMALMYHSSSANETMSVVVTANADKESYKQIVSEVDECVALFDLSLTEYSWLTQVLKDIYGADLTLSASQKDGKLLYTTSAIDRAKLVENLRLYDSSLLNTLSRYAEYRLEFGFDPKSNISIQLLDDFPYITEYNPLNAKLYGLDGEDANYLTNLDSYNLGMGYFVYNKDNNKHYASSSYISGAPSKWEIVLETAIPDGAKIIDYTEDYKDEVLEEGVTKEVIYLKETNLFTNKVTYSKRYLYNTGSNQYISGPSLEANYNAFAFTLDRNYSQLYLTVEYKYDDGKLVPVLSSSSKLIYHLKEYESEDKKVSFKKSNPVVEGCKTTITYTLTINDYEFSFETYEMNHDWDYENVTRTKDNTTCRITETVQCKVCGETRTESWISHTRETAYITPTKTQDGLYVRVCTVCGDVDTDPYHPRTSDHFVLEDLTEDFPNNGVVIGYAIDAMNWYNDPQALFNYISDEYQIILTVGTLLEGDVLDTDTSYQVQGEYMPYTYRKQIGDNTYDIPARLIKFDDSGLEAALARYGEGAYPIVLIASEYGSTAGVLVIGYEDESAELLDGGYFFQGVFDDEENEVTNLDDDYSSFYFYVDGDELQFSQNGYTYRGSFVVEGDAVRYVGTVIAMEHEEVVGTIPEFPIPLYVRNGALYLEVNDNEYAKFVFYNSSKA